MQVLIMHYLEVYPKLLDSANTQHWIQQICFPLLSAFEKGLDLTIYGKPLFESSF